jgi:hypothetical protein
MFQIPNFFTIYIGTVRFSMSTFSSELKTVYPDRDFVVFKYMLGQYLKIDDCRVVSSSSFIINLSADAA